MIARSLRRPAAGVAGLRILLRPRTRRLLPCHTLSRRRSSRLSTLLSPSVRMLFSPCKRPSTRKRSRLPHCTQTSLPRPARTLRHRSSRISSSNNRVNPCTPRTSTTCSKTDRNRDHETGWSRRFFLCSGSLIVERLLRSVLGQSLLFARFVFFFGIAMAAFEAQSRRWVKELWTIWPFASDLL
ncbi:uncharacterized protein BKA78DRAFT_317485, partial [Phyllosticta capitalensis]|uniref:uncharacterized protein n=1 Tax=Phyllosticta capitalensis TaxID=121624 RepID=UPI0031304869